MDAYQYKRLAVHPEHRQIRILSLLRGNGDDNVTCELRVRPISEASDNMTYESISYHWGNPEPSMKIMVMDEGQINGGYFVVTPNLHAALCAFRLENEPRSLWIDAICINQADLDEKSQQIPLLRQIYGGSIRTLVWLGEGTKESSRAISLLKILKKAGEKAGPADPNFSIFDPKALAEYELPSIFSRDYVSLLSLLDCAWFQRSWVVQEVTLSKQVIVYWGIHNVDWYDMVVGLDFAARSKLPLVSHPAFNNFVPIADEAAIYRNGICKLLAVLLRHRLCMATDPRDKIYAFLGLLNGANAGKIGIDVDYRQDLATIYINAAHKIAAHDQSLDILSLPAIPLEMRTVGLPSWVPDWRVATGPSLRRILSGRTNSLANAEESGERLSRAFCAAGTSVYSNSSSTSGELLVTEGHKIDTIELTGGYWKGYYLAGSITGLWATAKSIFDLHKTINVWETIARPHTHGSEERYVAGGNLTDAYIHTIITSNVNPEMSMEDLTREYVEWIEVTKPPPLLQKLDLGFLYIFIQAFRVFSTILLRRKPVQAFNNRFNYTIFRQMIRTESGYIGLASGDVAPGDEVFVLKGSKVPLILRRQQDYWRLVGDAYVHGIMYGEAFRSEGCVKVVLV